jgi:hypothetical protein
MTALLALRENTKPTSLEFRERALGERRWQTFDDIPCQSRTESDCCVPESKVRTLPVDSSASAEIG